MGQLSGFTREELEALLLQALEEIAALKREIAQLRGGASGGGKPASPVKAVPAFVKANVPEREKKERKRRSKGHARVLGTPTQVVVHALDTCPDCGRRLAGGCTHHVREVIDIPVVPVEITHHVVLDRWCGVCRKHRVARPDLSGEVIGKRRLGVRLMALVAHLATACRIPKRGIQRFLASMYGLEISLGEIVDILHAVSEMGRSRYEELRQVVVSSAYVHADETGWREDGRNGYLWVVSTADTRYFVYDHSRGHQVPQAVLGADFRGVLVSDFYGGYTYYLGEHQRCWVHLARDLHDLNEKHPDNAGVHAWVASVMRVYREALAFQSKDPRLRVRKREDLQVWISGLADPYARADLPQRVLAQRIQRFLPELFTFVEHPDVPADNNAAERSLRPSVIARKVSGGTRSPRGSAVRSILMSLFGTWAVRGEDGFHACLAMLANASA
jgi:transposase